MIYNRSNNYKKNIKVKIYVYSLVWINYTFNLIQHGVCVYIVCSIFCSFFFFPDVIDPPHDIMNSYTSHCLRESGFNYLLSSFHGIMVFSSIIYTLFIKKLSLSDQDSPYFPLFLNRRSRSNLIT